MNHNYFENGTRDMVCFVSESTMAHDQDKIGSYGLPEAGHPGAPPPASGSAQRGRSSQRILGAGIQPSIRQPVAEY